MINSKTSEESVWLTDGRKLYHFSEKKLDTLTEFGAKTVLTVTVFDTPIADSIKTVQSRANQPTRKRRMETVSGIVNRVNEMFSHLVNDRFKQKA